MLTVQDRVEARIIELFKGVSADDEAEKPETERLSIVWERVEPYAIDDAARKTAAALGLVDQGQKFAWKTAVAAVEWSLAVEFFVQVGSTKDIKQQVNTARSEIWHFMVTRVEFDEVLSELVDDIRPVADDVFVDRLRRTGEGVVMFQLTYRTRPDDIRRPIGE